MNNISSYRGTSPNNKEEFMAKIVVDSLPCRLFLYKFDSTEKHAFSYYINTTANCTVSLETYYQDTYTRIAQYSINRSWTKKEHILDIHTNAELVINFETVGTYYIYHAQLEKGEKCTNYSINTGAIPEQIYNAETRITNAELQLTQDAITAKVTSSSQWNNLINNVANNEKRINEAELKITADAITSTVTSSSQWNNLSSTVQQTAQGLTSKVEANSIISAINQSPETVTIAASKINLSGYVTIGKFNDLENNIYTTNTTTIDGGKITTGSITANKLSVYSLSALSADLGQITAGTIQSTNYLENISGTIFTVSTGHLKSIGTTNSKVVSDYQIVGENTIIHNTRVDLASYAEPVIYLLNAKNYTELTPDGLIVGYKSPSKTDPTVQYYLRQDGIYTTLSGDNDPLLGISPLGALIINGYLTINNDLRVKDGKRITASDIIATTKLYSPEVLCNTVTGNLVGNVTGSVIGNVTGNLVGNVTGQISSNKGGGWISDRDNAVVKGISYGQPSGQSYNPVISQLTTLGSWSIGNLSGEESLYFNYVTDTNYNSKNNVSTYAVIRKDLTTNLIPDSARELKWNSSASSNVFRANRVNHITWDTNSQRLQLIIDGSTTVYIPVQWQ